jgi:hypothetical protein
MARYMVRVDPARVEDVKRQLRALGIAIVKQVLDYIVVDMPPNMVPRVEAIPGVIEVVPEVTYRVAEVVPIEFKIAKLYPLILNPLTLPIALAESARMDSGKYHWVTGSSRLAVGADAADRLGVTGAGVKVAVLDTGVDPSLEDQLGVWGESTTTGQPLPWDENGHSTHVISTCCGRGAWDPYGRLLGVAPKAEVFGIKVLGYGAGFGSTSDIVDGILRAWKAGAKVINMSLGADIKPGARGDEERDPLCRAIRLVARDGVIPVIAAGNSGPGYASTPGFCSEAITVGAVDRDLMIARFSSRGHPDYTERSKPEVVAPGVYIRATVATGSLIDVMQWMDGVRRATISGTSMATPHATGVIALWVEYLRRRGVPDKAINVSMVKDIIRRYGKPYDPDYGHGVIRFEWVVRYYEEVLAR